MKNEYEIIWENQTLWICDGKHTICECLETIRKYIRNKFKILTMKGHKFKFVNQFENVFESI